MRNFDFIAGNLPLLVSIPHAGTEIPPEIAARMTPKALQLQDTDWHLPKLYAFLQERGVSVLAARYSRYVIDLNRPETDTNLYPGQDTTGLIPIDSFDKRPLYLQGEEPQAPELAQRLEQYWQPYHTQLRTELERLLHIYPRVALWDAHSIASEVPRFFAGKLPDLNLGTADGKSCSPDMMQAVVQAVQSQTHYSLAVNGRFKGGHITRHYGNPALGVHAIQLEMCQSTYMDETPPFAWRPDLAQQVQPLLQTMLEAVQNWLKTSPIH
jgi:N-formylglutamate deformylase